MSAFLPPAAFSTVPNMKVGDKVRGTHHGADRFGEVIEANSKLYFVRWADGYTCTGMQGFDYGDYLRLIEGGAK